MAPGLWLSSVLYVRLECVYGLGQAAHAARSVLLMDDALLGHLLNAGDGERQKVLGCGGVTGIDGRTQVFDLCSHEAAVVTVVRAAFGILPVSLDGAGDVGHLWLPMVKWRRGSVSEFAARSIVLSVACQGHRMDSYGLPRESISETSFVAVRVIT